MTAVQASERIIKMTINQPANEWKKTLDTLDIQHHYDRTFGAIIGLILKLVFPSHLIDPLLPALVN